MQTAFLDTVSLSYIKTEKLHFFSSIQLLFFLFHQRLFVVAKESFQPRMVFFDQIPKLFKVTTNAYNFKIFTRLFETIMSVKRQILFKTEIQVDNNNIFASFFLKILYNSLSPG